MNKVKTITLATAAVVVLAVLLGLLGCQSRTSNTVEIGEQVTPNLDTAAEVTPEIELATRVTPELEAFEETLDEQLSTAVNAKDITVVEQLLDAGASPDAIDSSGDPILKSAILSIRDGGETDIVKMLVAHGADVNALDGRGNALLPLAAGIGRLEVVQLLLDAGADVKGTMSYQQYDGRNMQDLLAVDLSHAPALTHATIGNHIEVIELLIAFGADVNQAESGHNETALHVAAEFNHDEIIKILLSNGADPNAPADYTGIETPLHFAAWFGSLEAAEALLDGGADVDAQIDQDLTPMMRAVKDGSSQRFARIVTLLLDRGADPNRQDINGNTALHYIALGGKPAAIPILIEHDASVDLQNNIGNTPLHQAAKWNQSGALSILIEQGASLDLKNAKGQTALDVASADIIIKILREAGAEE